MVGQGHMCFMRDFFSFASDLSSSSRPNGLLPQGFTRCRSSSILKCRASGPPDRAPVRDLRTGVRDRPAVYAVGIRVERDGRC